MLLFVSLLFFIIPILAFPIVFISFLLDKNTAHKKIYAFFLIILAAILLYYFIPDPSKDLYRYYIIMNKLSLMDLHEFYVYLTSRVEPLANIYFYIHSKLGNHNLIMITTSLISYSMLFYVLFNHQKNIKLINLDFNIIFIFMISVFYLVDDITGIRFCLARLIIYIALYLELYKGEKGLFVILLYCLAPLVHTSCLIFIIVRFFLYFIHYKFNIKTFFCLFLVSLTPNFIIKFARFFSGIPIFSSFEAKAIEYLELNAGFYPMFILQVIIMIFLIIILIYIKKSDLDTNKKYIDYVLIILCIGLLFVRSTSISTRFIRAGIIFSLPLLMDLLKNLKFKNKIIMYISLFMISAISIAFQTSHLIVEISYGNLFTDGLFKNLIGLLFK